MNEQNEQNAVFEGKHITVYKAGRWEFVSRNTRRPAVAIVAITDANEVVLVEQFRPPVGQRVIELPAGLSGDIVGSESESLLEAAKRELVEETGYTASTWTPLGHGYSSPGLTDESTALFLATGLQKTSEGGGDETEEITIHEVPLDYLHAWLHEKNLSVDLKLFSGLYLAERNLRARENHYD